jgi:beta-ketodecanoyl-[acyl-carrier-protein] synthase
MTNSVIAATGLFTPEQSISNAELVAAYNDYAGRFNTDHAAEIAEGDVAALTPSSVEFIEKASGINSRCVLDKAGVLDPARMAPNIPERADADLSIMAEMAVVAAFADAGADGEGAIRVGDRMAERLHLEAALRLLARHAAASTRPEVAPI